MVGVILNLAVWFGLHVIFREVRVVEWLGRITVDVPVLATLSPAALVLTVAAVVAVFRFNVGMIPVLLATSAAGILYYLVTGSIG